MATAQTTDSQSVQSVSSSQGNTFDDMLSKGSPMMMVAAAFMGMMGAGKNMEDFLKKLIEQGMALYTQGETYLMCDSWSSMEQLNGQYRKEGTNSVITSTMNDDLDPNNYTEEFIKGALYEGKSSAGFEIAYGDNPSQQDVKNAFVNGVEEFKDTEGSYYKMEMENFATSSAGETAYSSACYSAQIEENAGKEMLQLVQQLIGTFSSESSALMNIADEG
ncbi:MAG: hypothetical protein SNF33_03395 [Candidatus Algichlamydia australiensis]|nr:hypothetical protein [Chlamydiales bacterium]